MLGYAIEKPNTIPEAVWALKTSLNDYSWKNSNSPDMIEISISTVTERTTLYPGKPPRKIHGTAVSCIVGDVEVSSFSPRGARIDVASIAAKIPELRFDLREFSEADFENLELILLPSTLDFLKESEISEFEKLFMRYTHSYMEKSASAKILCGAIFLDILYRLDSYARGGKRESARDKYVSYYAQKARSIIDMRYAERITLASVAEELGITPGYLSTVFKRCVGESFSEKLFEKRIAEAHRLACESALSVSEIAERTGLGDDSNLRRRFKQKFGISIREYRSIAKEQTLYHEKPTRDKCK